MHDPRHARDRAAEQVLEARARRRRQRHRLAVAAEPARQPEDVDELRARPAALAAESNSTRASRADRRRRPAAAAAVALVGRSASDGRGGSASVPCRCHSSPWPRDEAGLREPRQRVRHRRPLGADEPAEQPVGEREREADAARARPGPSEPARCHSSSVRRTSRRGWSVIARCTFRSPARLPARRSSASEICGHGLTRSANASSSSAKRDGHERAPAPMSRSSRSSAPRSHGCSTSPAPTSSVAERSPTRTSTASTPSTHEHAGPPADAAAKPLPTRSQRRRRSASNDDRGHTWRATSACAGRAPRPGRRRDRAGSGTTTARLARVVARELPRCRPLTCRCRCVARRVSPAVLRRDWMPRSAPSLSATSGGAIHDRTSGATAVITDYRTGA